MKPLTVDTPLAGRNILVVEDEYVLAMDLEGAFLAQGCTVLGPASNVERALTLLETATPDAAVLDMNLNGVSSAPVAAALQERRIPYLIVSGYTSMPEQEGFRRAALLKKPYRQEELIERVKMLLT